MSKFQDFQGPLQKFQDSPGLEFKFSNSRTFQVSRTCVDPVVINCFCKITESKEVKEMLPPHRNKSHGGCLAMFAFKWKAVLEYLLEAVIYCCLPH